MKKMSLSLLTAAIVAIGSLTIAAPTQAATAITPQIQYSYEWFHFDSYPPYGYSDPDTGFIGNRVQVIQNSDGTYEGEYYGSTEI